MEPPKHPHTGEPLRASNVNPEDLVAALRAMEVDLLTNQRKATRRLRFLYWLAHEVLGELQDLGIENVYMGNIHQELLDDVFGVDPDDDDDEPTEH